MQRERITLAIVSPGRWGRQLLDALAKSDILEFAGVFSRSAENRRDIVKTYGGKTYKRYETLLADPGVDGVILPTPHFLHYPQTMAALEAGKSVFVEKPMANSLAECEEMGRTAADRNLTLAVGLQNRWVGSAWKLKSLIEKGELGTIATATAALGANLVPQYTIGQDWELDVEKIPGGPLDNLAVHQVDLLQFLLGPVKRVCGHVSAARSPTNVPSMATASLEFESGALASLMSHQISVYVSDLSIYGSKAAAHYKRAGQELLWEKIPDCRFAKDVKSEVETLEWEGPQNFTTALQAELENFGQCIRSGADPKVGAAEGISSLAVIRAIMKSSASGQHVEL